MVATQLKTFTPVGTAINIVAYMKNNCACHRHAGREHVVSPNDEGQNRNRGGRIHHGGIAEQASCVQKLERFD
jgi:hypothetical protein